MLRTSSYVVATLIAVASMSFATGTWSAPAPEAPRTPAQTRAQEAYEASGMRDQYFGEGTPSRETIVNIRLRASMLQWDPGQSKAAVDPMTPDWGTSTFVQTWDRPRRLLRTEWVRPRAAGGTRTYTEIFSDTGQGYVIGNDVNGAMPARTVQGNNNQQLHTMSGLRSRALLRELERFYVVLAMHDHPDRLSDYPSQTVGGKTYPTVQYRGDHGTLIVMFDPQTKLPAIVRSRDFDVFMGDANYDMALSDYRDVMGFKLPFHAVYTLNGVKIFDMTVNEIAVNAILASDAFTVPIAIRGKAAPPAPIAKVPYQWVLRRLAHGFYLDTELQYMDEGRSFQITDIAPNISHVTGGSHNMLIVATNDYLVGFDAPADDGQSQWVINAAAQKYPGKKFRYVVLTHHHIDHTGGVRAFAAEGATIVVGRGNGEFFRRVLAAPQGTNPYKMGPITPRVVEVADKWSVNDGGRVIEAYALETPHAVGYVIPYIPDAKLGWITDLWNPGTPLPMMANPAMVSVVRGVERAGIQPERFAGGHGSVGPYADLVQLVGR